jgi:hypothetical protein
MTFEFELLAVLKATVHFKLIIQKKTFYAAKIYVL